MGIRFGYTSFADRELCFEKNSRLDEKPEKRYRLHRENQGLWESLDVFTNCRYSANRNQIPSNPL